MTLERTTPRKLTFLITQDVTAANKVPTIRAAVCHDTHVARQCVEHDNANVLCLGAWIVGPLIAADVIDTFLEARFGEGEDVRRRVQLTEIEERYGPTRS